MTTHTLLSFSYISDVKSLPGFVKGGRDKVPKESGEYYNKLIHGWSESTIYEHIEAVATNSKNILKISARDFKTPYYDSGTGGFECQHFSYDFSVTQSQEDFSECIFTGTLDFKSVEMSDEVRNSIDDCFDFTFDKAVSRLPKGDRDLKELIYSLDDKKELLNKTFEFSYENDFSSFLLVHKKNQSEINVNDQRIEICFKESEPIAKMLSALKDMNKNLLLKEPEKTFLLSDV